MTNDPTIREQSYRYFLQEAPELLQVLEQDLLTLREDYSINKVHNLMRTTHTLKGAAASVELETIKTVAHSLEDIFKALFNPDLSIDPEIEALLFEGYECLRIPLTAELTGGKANDAEILDRAASIFAQLQAKLGDCFGEEAHIPSSVELGFDVTQSIFEVGVTQRLDEISAAIASAEPALVDTTLRTQSEVFQGLAESLNLPGFGAIAHVAIAALDAHPERVMTIAQTALANFQAGRTAVLNGDRTQGGQPSPVLQQLLGPSSQTDSYQLEVLSNESASTTNGTEPVSEFLNSSSVEVEVYSYMPLQTDLEFQDAPDFASVGDSSQAGLYSNIDSVAATSNAQAAVQKPAERGSSHIQELTAQSELHSVSRASDSELNLSESHHEESANLLLEAIWGEADEGDKEEDRDMEKEGDDVTASSPHHRASQRYTNTPPTNSVTSASSISRTVRVNVEHLEHLNYAIGELLTNQNRQSLQDEHLKAAVRTLLARLQQHQQLLSQLQDWSDRQFVETEQRQMGKRLQVERLKVAQVTRSDSVALASNLQTSERASAFFEGVGSNPPTLRQDTLVSTNLQLSSPND